MGKIKIIFVLICVFIVSNIDAQNNIEKKISSKLYYEIIQNILTKISYERIVYLKQNPCYRCDTYKHILDTNDYYGLFLKKLDHDSIFKYLSDIELYEYSKFGTFYTRSYDSNSILFGANTPFNSYYNTIMANGIIGIKKNKEIIFISGYLFLDDIKNYFFENDNFSVENIDAYVRVKYYNYDVEIKKIKRREVLFYSKKTDKIFKVKIYNKKNKEDKLEELKTHNLKGLPNSMYGTW